MTLGGHAKTPYEREPKSLQQEATQNKRGVTSEKRDVLAGLEALDGQKRRVT